MTDIPDPKPAPLPEPPKPAPTPPVAKPEHPKPEGSKPEPPKADPPKAELPKPPPAKATHAAAGAGRQPQPAGRSVLAVFCAIGFLLLAAGGFFLWQELRIVAAQTDPARLDVLSAQLRTLQQRVDRLAAAPAPPPAPPPVDLAPVTARLAALDARITALEQRPAAPPDNTAALSAAVTALQAKIAAAQAGARQVSDAAARAARLESAGVALSFGQPLGAIPGAPPALARFATAAPPTEATLRRDFDSAARRAAAASRPASAGLSFTQRVWQRISGLVTVREGNKVLVGLPAAKTLADARGRLEAGDLAGAVASLSGLDAPAAQAMAGWKAEAQSLLDARAALAKLAAG
jgi:hypothetical protein